MQGGGGGGFILRLPFGGRYSPVLCQRVLQFFTKDLKKGPTLILRYLDEFMVLRHDKALLAEVTNYLVKLLVDKGCLISPKLVSDPVRKHVWGNNLILLRGRFPTRGEQWRCR